ncbi:amino acid adenylation domain-containing protein [Chamaesiphon sp. VAR_48_metabat_403]|uniref:hybrid non-ribosomal peptide synthetase/type I polyketide synthase n=1 Tax=Chamaesiphon sp. VAR_48_metabat_403 TaxID=2964700 RepID=UPI00286D8ABE|nr:amino acid adenylation domain-containing protein [Chamaesiphon sp. VAR_48_metabat_403]
MEIWLDRLRGAVPTQLPIAIKDSLKQPLCDAERQLELSGSIDRLSTFIDSEANVKIDTIVLGAWALLLARYSCTEDVLFGTNIYSSLGRSEEILPIRVRIEDDRTLLPWLQELESQPIDGDLPTLAQICEGMQVRASDLLTSVLLFTRSNDENLEPINYPLVLKVVTGERLELKLAYDSQRFELAAIDRLLGHLQTLIEGMVANLHQTLAEVPMLTAAERHQLLVEWNDTQVDYPHDKTIHQVFTEQVARTPDEIAVILPALDGTPDLSLTYRQLNDRSNNLAIALQEMGVETETPVAMCLERSIESIVAILGILKAGGVYVPLDPAYPSERLALMLADIPSPVLLTQSHLVDRLPSHAGSRVVCLDVEMPQPRFSFREAFAKANALRTPTIVSLVDSTNAENLAYINFTSGSTGRPKGVAIPHRAVLRLVLGSQFTPLDRDRTLLQLAPTSFDAATLEIWGALLHGGRCILFPGNGIPDVRSLGTIISNYKITTLWLTAALFNTIVAEAPETLKGVSEILTGGEALSPTHIRQAQSQLVDTQLINGYGPTESTTFTCCYRIPNPIDPQATSISIGRPIANTQVYILDAALQPVPIGIPGELYIGGDGLARGYIDRPELTAERFVAHPFSEDPNAQLYKTGDLVRYLADGNIEFMGRSDDQVKIRGYRIELGEIETKLSQHETVREAIVIVRDARLVAYITAAANQSPQPHELKAALRATLPEYMVPNAIVVLAKMPLTANGKADRRALPDLQMAIDPNFVAPSTATERTIAEIWGDVLSLERVGIEANFFDLGGTSLLGLQMVTRVQKQLNTDFRAVKLYQYPTIRTLARFLDRADTQNLPKSVRDRADAAHSTSTDVAIIGMVGRFPGANDVAEFWDNLCEGIDTNSWFTDAQIDPSIDPELRADPHYVRARGILADADMFDAAFFGISPREAEVMDPQARIFLELAHQALETVGYTPDRYPGQIGLYAGSGQNTYFEKHICTRSEIVDRLGEFQTMLANEKDFLTTRTSYKLGLTGPSLSINTACSTSLVAIIQAVRSLSDRHCDMALAGGISITTPQNRGYLYQEGGMLSPDGRCRPFDAHAGGTLFNSGAGIVVLKRVEDALADGDRIYAVIKGVGLNNDGADKVSFTAPSVNGQAAAIAMAHADCGCDPKTISYVETHGTATAMGDPIEIEALTLAFQQPVDAEQFCAIGSLKGNIGHVVAAAGVAGVIKTALALDRQQLPPSINFESPNPAIDFASSPFFVNTQLTPWQAGATPLRAGVSSFGVGGTNAHIILEQAPTVPASSKSRPCQLLVLSAKTAAALDKATANLQAYLAQTTENLADIAFTLQQGRTSFNHRRTIVCRDAAEAVAILETQDVRSTATRHTEHPHPDVEYKNPGQGTQ